MKLDDNKLYLTKKLGESAQQRRVRLAHAILKKLQDDKQLREELALELALHESLLNSEVRKVAKFNNNTHTEEIFEEC